MYFNPNSSGPILILVWFSHYLLYTHTYIYIMYRKTSTEKKIIQYKYMVYIYIDTRAYPYFVSLILVYSFPFYIKFIGPNIGNICSIKHQKKKKNWIIAIGNPCLKREEKKIINSKILWSHLFHSSIIINFLPTFFHKKV